VQVIADASLRTGGHAAVCQLFFHNFRDRWMALDQDALCGFVCSLHALNHIEQTSALLSHLKCHTSTSPKSLCVCIPIWTSQEQWKSVKESYRIIESAGYSVPTLIFSCVIKACAEEAVDFATFMTIFKNARASNARLVAVDWDNAAIAASHNANASELRSFVCEASASGQTLGAAATAAVLLATNERAGQDEVFKLLKMLPMPLPSQCVAVAASALVRGGFWQDAVSVLESGSGPLSLTSTCEHDFQIMERCSQLFHLRNMPTDALFAKAALHFRSLELLAAGNCIAAAQLVAAALRNRLVDAPTCTQVILALERDAEATEACTHSTTQGDSVSVFDRQQQHARGTARKEGRATTAVALRQSAIDVFALACQEFETSQLGEAADSVIMCLHHQQQPNALIDVLDRFVVSGQQLSDHSYAAAVLATETLGMHERALALLGEIQNRELQLTALRAGSRCAC
jgi:hypothetical protein